MRLVLAGQVPVVVGAAGLEQRTAVAGYPALDGGRLLFVVIEKIKGSRLTPRFEAYANGIGFSLLIFLTV